MLDIDRYLVHICRPDMISETGHTAYHFLHLSLEPGINYENQVKNGNRIVWKVLD